MVRKKKYEHYTLNQWQGSIDSVVDWALEKIEKMLYFLLLWAPLLGVKTITHITWTITRSIHLLLKNTVINNQPNALLFKKYREKIENHQKWLHRIKNRYDHPETKKRIVEYWKKWYGAMSDSKYQLYSESFKKYNGINSLSEYKEFLQKQLQHGNEHIQNNFLMAHWHNRNKLPNKYKNYVFLWSKSFDWFYDGYKEPHWFVNFWLHKEEIASTTIHEGEHYFQGTLNWKRLLKEDIYENTKNWNLTPVSYWLFLEMKNVFHNVKNIDSVYTPLSKGDRWYRELLRDSYKFTLLKASNNYYQLNSEILARIREIQFFLNICPWDEFTLQHYEKLCSSSNQTRNIIKDIIKSKELFIEFMNKVY